MVSLQVRGNPALSAIDTSLQSLDIEVHNTVGFPSSRTVLPESITYPSSLAFLSSYTSPIMSFGFGVGDFVAVAQLSWNLYRYCYLVARGAPSDFQLLVQEISTLSQSIKLLEEEAKDPNSILTRAGDDRVRMVKEMMRRVEVTLNELEKYAKKYEKLGDMSRPKRKQIWDKLKWSSEASDLDGLRSRVGSSTLYFGIIADKQ